MVDETKELESFHRRFAVDAFNGTWDLMDKTDRTPDEDCDMIHAAHASRYHWGKVGTAVEFSRGEQQISRVYAVLRMAAPAFYHAHKTLELCLANDIGDFDLAFAHEAMARAAAVAGDAATKEKHLSLARAAGEKIAKDDDREYFFSELATIP